MQRKAIFCLLTSLIVNAAAAQTTYLPLNTDDYQLLDRLETKSGKLSSEFFTTIKPVSRKDEVNFLLERRMQAREMNLSTVTRYDIDHAISVSGEWVPNEDGAIDSRVPWFKTFYLKQPDFVHVKTKDFFLSFNPVISATGIYEKYNNTGTSQTNKLLSSSRGVELRGWITKRIGFYSYFTDNQEKPVSFVDQYINKYSAVPGADYYKVQGSHYDYILARGYFDFAVIKDHLNVTAGYDQHFIGDGIRSLFLSDFSAGASFLRLNTKIWKLNYQNLYLELTPQYTRGSDVLLPHKYATVHHLSVNATKWLNFGLFESVIFSRRNSYEFAYMNPIIFYRAIERGLGSPDNVNIGLNFKAIAAKHFQFYGQFLLDEFTSKEFFSRSGYWANKWGLQLGGKYFDALGIKNLDLQGEINIVRPYTYTHYDSTSNYTHYNQPLAHPLGAGFEELIGVAKYQPTKNLYLTLKGMYYKQGVDTGASNYGNDIFADYNTRTIILPGDSQHGYKLITGPESQCAILNLNLTYRLRENLFIDLGAAYRKKVYQDAVYPSETSTYVYGGLRLNIARRDYTFY